MAARKKHKGKAKGKSKARSKSTRKAKPARKPASRKKAARRTVSRKKAPVRRVAAATAKRPARRRPAPAKAGTVAPAVEAPPPGQRIGVVAHYFTEISVAVIKLESGTLRVGDNIHIRGHTTDFGQRVDSLQVNHAPVVEVGPNDDFGIKVRDHAREHDVVYKVK